MAFKDFFNSKTTNVFYSAAAQFLTSLYESKCNHNECYFLDKTPRYYMILDELLKIFPEAKFIVLTRNPLDVIASSIDTWGKKGCWNTYAMKLDLTEGIRRITNFLHENDNLLHISYQDLTSSLLEQVLKIEKYLGVNLDLNAIQNIGDIQIGGALGDPIGVRKYSKVQAKPTGFYLNTLNGVLRKRWVRNYLNTLSEGEMEMFDINKLEVLKLLKNTPTKYSNVLSDFARMTYGQLYNYLDIMHFVNTFKTKRFSKKVGFR